MEVQIKEVRLVRFFFRKSAHGLRITQHEQLEGTFVEVIGSVVNESTIKFLMSLTLDSDKELGRLSYSDFVAFLTRY